jgi:hypothetical protein
MGDLIQVFVDIYPYLRAFREVFQGILQFADVSGCGVNITLYPGI